MDEDEVAKQLLVRAFVEQWHKDNPELVRDLHELAGDVVMFNLMWGTEFYIAHRKMSAEEITPNETK